MRASILIPVQNNAPLLPELFRALTKILAKKTGIELILVNHAATDGSAELLQAFAAHRQKQVKLLFESVPAPAVAWNRAFSESEGEALLLLQPQAIPAAGWLEAHLQGLEEADFCVGAVSSRLPAKPTAYERLAAKLFERHSERTATAQGHALPWGSAANFSLKRAWLDRVGPFSLAAGGAYDIDWRWRALLQGARIAYLPKAKVNYRRALSREQLLRQFESFGLEEAWLQRSYAFLLDESSDEQPLQAGIAAFERLRYHSQAAKLKSLLKPLEETAVAFAAGVRAGYERPHRECGLERKIPGAAIHWQSGKNKVTLFVAGKGITEFHGPQLKLWQAWLAGGETAVAALLQKSFGLAADSAKQEAREFREALAPVQRS